MQQPITCARLAAFWALLGMALVALSGCERTAPQAAPAAPPPAQVTVARPVVKMVTDHDEFVGRFVAVDAVEVRYDSPSDEFALSRLELRRGVRWDAPGERGVEILLCTDGRASLHGMHGDALELTRGQAALAPASAGRYAAEGAGVIYRAAVGRSRGKER